MMKVPASIRRLYNQDLEKCQHLKPKVDQLFRQKKHHSWHYDSRIKSLESYALKIESGRFGGAGGLEDVLGCWLVVENSGRVAEAEAFVRDAFAVRYRKPEDNKFTSKEPHSFVFDDLRIYASWKDVDSLPESGLADTVFEVQIKTFLQHAWSIATHDLIYKTDEVDWGKQRIAYQIKAMLENAEISIQKAGALAESEGIPSVNRRTKGLKQFLDVVTEHWSVDELPSDLNRLAENVRGICDKLKIRPSRLRRILRRELSRRGGSFTLNLSPFGVVVEAISWQETNAFRSMLADGDFGIRVLIPGELEFPDEIRRDECVNAVFLD